MKEPLHKIALFAERNHRSILIVALTAMAVSILLVSRVRFDPDILGLLPEDDPVVQTFRQTLDEFGALDLLLVVVRVPEGAVLDPYQEIVGELGQALEELPEMEWVEYRIGEPEELLRTFYPRAFFFLDEDEREQIRQRLTPEGVEQATAELRQRMITPQAMMLKQLLRLDPLGLSDVFLDQLEDGRGALGVDWTSGYYLSKDRRLFLLLAKPTGAAQNIEFTADLVEKVDVVKERLTASWQEQNAEDIESGELADAPDIALGGGYLTALDDANLIKRDVLVNAFSSMGVVLLLFLFAFRRLGVLVYAFLPLSCGLLVTFGLAGATGTVLSSATSGCAALLVGLGIDFVIVSYGRYVEERQNGASSSDAIRRMTGSSGRAVVIGGITSAATFFSFTTTEFTGLRQMGLLTATGILLCMVAVLLLLPALLAWSEARHSRRRSLPTLYVHGFGAARLVHLAMSHPKPTLLVGGLITLLTLTQLPRLEFETAIQNLRPDGNRGIQVQEEVSQHFGSNFKYMMLVLEAESQEAVLDLADRAAQGARPMVEAGELYRVDSVSTLIPSPERQRQVLSWLAENRAGDLDPARLRARFDAALRARGLNPAAFAEGMDLLGEALSATEPITVEELQTVGSTRRLMSRYLRQTDDSWKSVVYLYPPQSKWRREPPPQAEELAASLGPGAQLTGVNVVSRSLRRQVWFDAVLAALLGTLSVAILLWFDYRRIGDTLLSLVPLSIGIVWMLGTMAVLGLKVNFMNIFVTTMIIGIGVDYGVHMLHRRRELEGAPEAELRRGLSETGRAIAMAAVTTSVGFGSLALSHYPGLRSIGFVAILGAVATALVAITFLPGYLALERQREIAAEQRRPQP